MLRSGYCLHICLQKEVIYVASSLIYLNSYGTLHVLFRSIDYWSVVKSRKPNNDALTWFFTCLVNICYTSPVCPIYNPGISTPESLQIPIISSKTLLLFSFFSVGTPSNLTHSLLPYCSSSSISCWFCKFCFLISKIWCWSMILSDSCSAPLSSCFVLPVHLWNAIQFISETFRIDFNIILLIFCSGYKTVARFHFLTHQFFDLCLSYASFSYGCFIWSRNNFVTQFFISL